MLVLAVALTGIAPQAFAEGKTDYTTPPWWKDIFAQSWGSSPDLTPAELFWDKGTFFTNPTNITNAKNSAAGITTSGKTPFSGAQRWEETYIKSLPKSTFTNPPASADESYLGKPEFAAWAQWIKAHPQYQDVANDGGAMPQAYRSWNGSWGHVSPLMPLDAADIPSGMTGGTYGDLFALKWGQSAGKAGAYGVMLSDFVDSHPHWGTMTHDFNPRITAAFAKAIGASITGTPQQQATWIDANKFNEWTDFWGTGYGKFYAALAANLKAATGHEALVLDQGGLWPAFQRLHGQDARLMIKQIPSANIVYFLDTMTMSPGRGGDPMVNSTGFTAMFAAREPDARFGPNMHSDDADFWNGVKQYWGTLSATDQKERGLKELKRLWLETEWAHIATRQGATRRAIAFASRNYWDAGTLDATLVSVMRSIVPTRPFGLAFYYSTAIERARELPLALTGNMYSQSDSYMSSAHKTVSDLRNTWGIATDYYVSDAGLPSLQASAKPAAWIVLDRYDAAGKDLLPAAELTALKAVAPVLSSKAEIDAFAKPLSYSANATGVGFYDQSSRLVVTASNLLASQQNVTVTLKGLPNGQYQATDLFDKSVTNLTVANGQGSFAVPVTRWDTRAFALTPPITAATLPSSPTCP